MKRLIYIVFFSSFFLAQAQQGVEVILKETIKLDADRFIGMNMFDELFYVKNEVFYKKVGGELHSYQNRLLGTVGSVDVLNSLETTLFYKDFNTAIQLDKKLGEIGKIDFNSSNTFSTNTYVASASNKRLWVFNADTQKIQVYNPQQDVVEVATQAIEESVVDFYSNYNYCWVLTKRRLLQYNIYGNLLNSYVLHEFEEVVFYKDSFILKKKEQLYTLLVGEKTPKLIELPQFKVKDFSVINETLYIYDGKELHSFKINLNKE